VIKHLARLGYDRFQIVPPCRKVAQTAPPIPAREGSYVERKVTGHDSGLFGMELLYSRWMAYENAVRTFLTDVRDENFRHVGIEDEWCECMLDTRPGCASPNWCGCCEDAFGLSTTVRMTSGGR
jgi:hypothetical protein